MPHADEGIHKVRQRRYTSDMASLAAAERHLDRGRVYAALGDSLKAKRAVEAGLAVARGTDSAVEAALLLEFVRVGLAGVWDPASVLAVARDAVAVASRAGLELPEAELFLGNALYMSMSDECIACYRRARRRAERRGRVDIACEASIQLIAGLHTFGQGRSALRAAELAVEYTAARRARSWQLQAEWQVARLRAMVFADYERALPELERLVGVRGLGTNMTHVRADLAVFSAHTGRFDVAYAALRRAAHTADHPFARSLVGWARTQVEMAAGHPQRALRAAEEASRETAPLNVMLERDRLWTLFDLGRTASPDLVPDRVYPIFAGARLELLAFTALAAGDLVGAEELWTRAATAWDDICVYVSIECRWAAAELARRAGSERAISRLRRLEERALRHGFAPLVARIRRSLHGDDASGRARTVARDLSRREREVLELVGRGLSSREIASTLGIGSATVETHVRKAMAKLGAERRIEAALLLDSHSPTGACVDGDAALLLSRLARGDSVSGAASSLGWSRRTATRRLAEARDALGVTSSAEAVILFASAGPRGARRAGH
jgi:DNA-binding CsgD family transcriptional regulator